MIFLGPCLESALAQTLPSASSVISAMTLANNYFQAQFPNPGLPVTTGGTVRPSDYWFRAVYFEGLMDFYQINPQPSFISYAVTWGTGNSWGLVGGNTDRNANDQCAGQSYIDLYNLNPTPAYIANIQADLNNILASTAPVTDWWWIDAVQMAMPTWAKMGALTGNTKYYNEMYTLYANTRNVQGTAGLYNPVDNLWWRDSTFVNPPFVEANGKSCYWCRGNGWVYAALVRVLDVLPSSDPHYAEYLSDFQAMSAAILAVQQSDGFWTQSLFDITDFPGPETSGTALFTYGMAWGVRKGFLPAATYESAAVTAWNAMMADALHTNGFLGYVQDTGDQPVTGVTYTSVPTFQDIGVGCFLLAGSEMVKLVDSATVTPTSSSTPTRTSTASATPSGTPTMTSTQSSSATASSSMTATPSLTVTATASSTPTASFTASLTPSLTVTWTATSTPTATKTPTATATMTDSTTPTPSATLTVPATSTSSTTSTRTFTSTATSTPTFTFTSLPLSTFTPTPSATATASSTSTPTSTTSMTATPSLTNTGTATPSLTPSTTRTMTASTTATPSATLTVPASFTPTSTDSAIPTVTSTDTASLSPTVTLSLTPSGTPTWTSTFSPTATDTNAPIFSATPTASSTASASPTSTTSPTPTQTPISTPTDTTTPSATASQTSTASFTATGTPTASASSSSTPTGTATLAATLTGSFTPSFTPTFTPSHFFTFTPSLTATPLPSLTVTSIPTPSIATLFLYPNPVKGPGPVTLQISLGSAAPSVTVEVLTVSFRRVDKITLSNVPAGITDIPLPLTDGEGRPLANGLYYVEALASGEKFIDELLVLR